MTRSAALAGGALLALSGCATGGGAAKPASTAVVQPVALPTASPAPTPTPKPGQFAVIRGPTTFTYQGETEQGGWIRGQVPGGAVSATFDGEELSFDSAGKFFAGFDRDAGPIATLSATLADGRIVTSPITVRPRAWQIERVNVARRTGGPSEAFMAIRRPELAQIAEARSQRNDTDGWKQAFIWPVKGRISGRFGSQRIYRGEPGAYHSGLDIATGESGTPFVAPADGVVVLAAGDKPFSLEGQLLIIDHGNGLNSAFLHASRLAVKDGDVVKRGQYIGNIGSSGRATGPHLHWSIKWRDARLDPLLFLPPM
ncbi:M23 family metallopeptidase [Tsuneonella flava]|uniref:M23 family metallopeptidase n=1 Tax=Tsuneonella flava TaxID=2055955 RepID=UPI001F212311|nr:M23 family metallopeptidase [Tsuneonella flava]